VKKETKDRGHHPPAVPPNLVWRG